MIVGVISRSEMVVGGLIGGGVRGPTVLRSTRDRRCAGVEVVLSMQVRDLRVRLEDRRKGKYRSYRKQAIRRTIVCLGLICGPVLGTVCG